MGVCGKCGKETNEKFNFCPFCGSKTSPDCVKCKRQLLPEFHFCPSCGQPRNTTLSSSSMDEDWSCSSEDSTRSQCPSLADVKRRLQALRQKRHSSPSEETSVKKPKKDLVVHIGVKVKQQDGSFTLLHKNYGGGIRKVQISRGADYQTCLMSICKNFKMNFSEQMYLLDNETKKVAKEGFKLHEYVKAYSYVGTTRLYLAVESMKDLSMPYMEMEEQPPALTPQKIVAEKNPVQCSVLEQEITLEQVEQHIKESVAQKSRTGGEKGDERLVRPGHTPFYYNNVIVRYFTDMKKKDGIKIDVVHSDWGKFALIPDELTDEFFKVRDTITVEDWFFIDAPLLYFLKVVEVDVVNINVVTESVVQLDASLSEKFSLWYRQMKNKISDDEQ